MQPNSGEKAFEREYLIKSTDFNCSPRRYGKTSLITQVIHEMEIPATIIDFFAITDEKSVFDNISDGIGTVLAKLLPKNINFLERLHILFDTLNPTVELSALPYPQQAPIRR